MERRRAFSSMLPANRALPCCIRIPVLVSLSGFFLGRHSLHINCFFVFFGSFGGFLVNNHDQGSRAFSSLMPQQEG